MRRLSRLSLFLAVLGLFLCPSLARAQSGLGGLSGELKTLGQQYVDGYVQPITDAFGANLNAGLFRTADVGNGFVPGLPFNVYLGVSTSGALMGPTNKSFEPPEEEFERTFTQDGQEVTQTNSISVRGPDEVPNVFGDTDPDGVLEIRSTNRVNGRVVKDTAQTFDVPPGLVDTPIAPLIVPQLGVGAIAGTDVQVRYLPKTNLSYSGTDFGTIGLVGVAVRHDIDQWIPAPLPLNLAVQGSWNEFTFSSNDQEILNASGWALNAQVSKGVPVLPVTFYGGLQYENFSVEYDYTFTSPLGNEIPLSLEQDASNTFRALGGVSLTLAVIRINVDYALGNGNNVVTAGLGVRL